MTSLIQAAPAESRVQAPFGRRAAPVTDVRAVGAYGVISVRDPSGPVPQPGQFYMLAAVEGWGGREVGRPYLPRACSVARARGEEEGVGLEFLLEEVGPGTRVLMSIDPGQELWLTGPLGRGFRAPRDGRRALLVGGGAGVAPLIIWQDWLLAARHRAPALLGFRDADRARAAALLTDARVCTDDGSAGHHGPVTDLLRETLGGVEDVEVSACGPEPMLAAVRAACRERGVFAQLALEAPMACGYGACFGCVVPTVDGYARVCVEGPVFAAERLADRYGTDG